MSAAHFRSFLPFPALAVLLFLSSCEDPESRQSANDSSKKVNEIRLKIEQLEKKSEDNAQSLKAAEERLMKHIDERSDKLALAMASNHELLIKELGTGISKNLSDSTGLAKTSREEFEHELAAEKASAAEEIQKMRAELKNAVEELRKFMDNQLKETYPYAYQPKRAEPAAPPAIPEAK